MLQCEQLTRYEHLLRRLRFDWQISNRDLKIVAIPKVLADLDGNVAVLQTIFIRILQELDDNDGIIGIPNEVMSAIDSESCRGAIMFGDFLTPSLARRLLDDLAECIYPYGNINFCGTLN